jgi:hypothetical protein
VPARVCAAHVQRQDTDCAGAAAGGRGVRAQVACSHLLARHARQSVLLLHTLHQLFFSRYLLFFYSTLCTHFFLPPMRCASMYAIMYMYIYMHIFFCIYCILFFCIFFFFAPDALCKYVCYHVYVHIHVYSYIYTYTYIHI